ncbi:MAG: hypothetical protein DRJ38_09495 [Thermoprotei archaeon]|nr:MAG: hypothetical protein DRJ38_09495 [Thermoprotei archaeon]
MKWIRTRVSEEVYDRILDYASRNGISKYEAVRKLIMNGLKFEDDIYRLLKDDEFILSLITVKIKYDRVFAIKVSKMAELGLGEEL